MEAREELCLKQLGSPCELALINTRCSCCKNAGENCGWRSGGAVCIVTAAGGNLVTALIAQQRRDQHLQSSSR